MTSEYTRELQVALAAVRSAARICRSVQAAIDGDALEKRDRSPVTVADFSSQAVICRALRNAFPDDPVIGEEDSAELRLPENAAFFERVEQELRRIDLQGSRTEIAEWIDHGNSLAYAPRFWTLDPIDGTKGFLRGEQYAISLALIVEGCVTLSVLGCPNLPLAATNESAVGAIFSAVRGRGCVVSPLDGTDADSRPVVTSNTAATQDACLCESVESGHSAHGKSAQIAERLGITRPPCRLDSQAKYAVVARGEADIYLRLPTRADYREKIWDHAGGVLVVEEAGGRVTDLFGKPLNFRLGHELSDNRGILVTNGRIHQDVLNAIRELAPPQG